VWPVGRPKKVITCEEVIKTGLACLIRFDHNNLESNQVDGDTFRGFSEVKQYHEPKLRVGLRAAYEEEFISAFALVLNDGMASAACSLI